MNYENSINGLIKQLKGISNDLMEDEFPKCVNVVKKAATALSTLQAENKRLKSLLGESGQDLWSKENQRVDRLEAENEKLREMYQKEKAVCHATQAELEQTKQERDVAIEQLHGNCPACVHYAPNHNEGLCRFCCFEVARDKNVEINDNWKWRGPKEE